MSLFQKYKLWVTPQPKYDRSWSPPTSFSADSEYRKTVLWVNTQLVQRKWVTTVGNCSLEVHSPWPDLRKPRAALWAAPAESGSSPLPLQSDLVFSVGREVLELWTGKVEYSFKLGNQLWIALLSSCKLKVIHPADGSLNIWAWSWRQERCLLSSCFLLALRPKSYQIKNLQGLYISPKWNKNGHVSLERGLTPSMWCKAQCQKA